MWQFRNDNCPVPYEEGVSLADKEDNPNAETALPDDSSKLDVTDEGDARASVIDAQEKPAKADIRRVSISIRTLVIAAVIVGWVASVAAVGWLYIGAKTKLDEQARQAANNSRAEQIALDYAVEAATINFKELDLWKKNLVEGTTGELREKLNDAGTSMEQILTPLQWNSVATPLAAKVRSNTNGTYVVDAFVGVETKTMQEPNGLQSTATYSISIDSNNDWQITQVGGVGAVVSGK